MSGNQIDAKLRISVEGAQEGAAGLKGMEANLKGVGQAADTAAAAASKAAVTVDKVATASALSAKQQAAAMRGLPAQIQDIVVSLAGGQNPLTVLLQQGSQIATQFGTAGNALRSVAGAAAGLANPVTILGAAVAGVFVAMEMGARETAAFKNAVGLTANAAGVTAGQFNEMAQRAASAAGATSALGRDVAQAVVASGMFGADAARAATVAATAYAKVTGTDAADAVKLFEGFTKNAAKAATELNERLHFLNLETYERIKALQEQGRLDEAAALGMEALTTHLQAQRKELSPLGKAIETVGGLWSAFWTAAADTTKAATVEQKLDGIRAKLNDPRLISPLGYLAQQIGLVSKQDQLREQQADLQEQLRMQRRSAGQQAEAAATQSAAIAASDRLDKLRLQNDKQLQLNKAVADYKRDVDALAKVGKEVSPEQQAKDLAAIREKFKDKQAAGTKGISRLAAAEMSFARAELELARLEKAKAIDEERRGVDLRRQIGLTGAAEYYANLRGLAEREAAARLERIDEEIKKEEARRTGDTADKARQRARLKELEVERKKAVNEGNQAIGEINSRETADQVREAQDAARSWADAWRAGVDRVNELTASASTAAAKGVTDPLERARAEADLAVADIKRRNDEVRSGLERQLTAPGTSEAQRAMVQEQINALNAQAAAAEVEARRLAELRSAKEQISEVNARLALQESEIARQVEAGDLSTLAGERLKLDARAKALQQMGELVALQSQRAATPAEQTDAAQAAQQLKLLSDKRTDLERSIATTGKNEFSTLFNAITTGSKTAGEALRDMVGNFAKSMLDLIGKRLGEQLVNSLMGGANGGGGAINTAASWITSTFFHQGGLVGSLGGMSRSLPESTWQWAPRYHTGGIAGLAADELPAVLRKGEEVLTADDPRHRSNGGMAAGVNVGGISVTVTGASGNEQDNGEAARSLQGVILATVNQWAVDQSRSGGILARG